MSPRKRRKEFYFPKKLEKGTVLFAGCGMASRPLRVAKAVPKEVKVVGMDAKEFNPFGRVPENFKFLKGDFTKKRLFKEKSFDVAEFNWSIFPHNQKKALNNIVHWMKEDARIIIRVDPAYKNIFPKKFEKIREKLEKHGFSVTRGLQHPDFNVPLTPREAAYMIGKNEHPADMEGRIYNVIIATRGKHKFIPGRNVDRIMKKLEQAGKNSS
jgi:hypothetical protein